MTVQDDKKICRDFEDHHPGCLQYADESYTMRFDDIGEPPIYFCSNCGQFANIMVAALNSAMKTRPGFTDKLSVAIDNAMKCPVCSVNVGKTCNIEEHIRAMSLIGDVDHNVYMVHKL